MRKNYTIDEACAGLSKKNDVRINGSVIEILTDKITTKEGNVIDNPKKRNDIGNGSWGKIDYLTKYCGFVLIRVDSHREDKRKNKKVLRTK